MKQIEIQGLASDALNLTINKRQNIIVTELFNERPWIIANIEQVLDKSSENDEFEDPAESMMKSPSNDKLVVLKLSSRLNLLSSNTGLIDFGFLAESASKPPSILCKNVHYHTLGPIFWYNKITTGH